MRGDAVQPRFFLTSLPKGLCSVPLCPRYPLLSECLQLWGRLVLLHGEIKYFDFVS